ncbi:hypothetical protein EJB05_36960, partial [Eragrostis curvula]
MAEKTRANDAAWSDQEDRISALPDGVLEHILGFLPAHQAVQECACPTLAPPLEVHSLSGRLQRHNISNFVSPLLLLRGHITLDEVKFDFEPYLHLHHDIAIWIRHALLCKAQVFIVHFNNVKLGDPPLVSNHLRRIELESVDLEGKFLSFASCPSLEVLKMKICEINLGRISSQSLKHLRIEYCTFRCREWTHISVPSLIILRLNDFMGTTPLLQAMPSLDIASVEPDVDIDDYCYEADFEGCCGLCAKCCGDDDHKGSCVLLGGLLNAMNLELTACPDMFIFGRDLRWCPVFSNLKTLWLNEWCVAAGFDPLICLLEHSPVLEKLTLQLSKGQKWTKQTVGSTYKLPTISGRLNIVEIKCAKVDSRVYKILHFLSKIVLQVNIIMDSKSSRLHPLEEFVGYVNALEIRERTLYHSGYKSLNST